mmetsp:Transcript_5742/g.13061  ORF Transcript_5742/g.13061 Transcript_5742/m.13061 type:complete len:276 (+) Transcript_5742:173-1000(+)
MFCSNFILTKRPHMKIISNTRVQQCIQANYRYCVRALNKLLVPKLKRLLHRLTNNSTSFRRSHLMDTYLITRRDIRHILWGDKYELTMIHRLGDLDEVHHSNLPCNRVEEDVEFIHDAKRRFKAFANGKEEREGGEATFASAEGLDVLRLAVFILVVLLNTQIQLPCLMIKLHLASASLLVQKLVKSQICLLGNMSPKRSPPLLPIRKILPQCLGIPFNGINEFHLGIEILLRAKVLVTCHSRVGFAQVPTFLLLFNLLQLVLNPTLIMLRVSLR